MAVSVYFNERKTVEKAGSRRLSIGAFPNGTSCGITWLRTAAQVSENADTRQGLFQRFL